MLRDLLSIYDEDEAPAESPLEVFARRAIAAAKLPPPVRQHPVVVGGRSFRVDLAYPSSLVAIELDGYRFHSSRLAWDRDRAKVRVLRRAGWKVVEGTYESVRVRPSEFIDDVATALRAHLTFGC